MWYTDILFHICRGEGVGGIYAVGCKRGMIESRYEEGQTASKYTRRYTIRYVLHLLLRDVDTNFLGEGFENI